MTLAVPEIFVASLRLTWQQRRPLFDIALIPIIFSLVIDLLFEPMLVDRNYTVALHSNPLGTFFGMLAFLLVSMLPWSAFAVGWTRFCLIGPDQHGGIVIGAWTTRERRYFGAMVKLFLVYAACLFAGLLLLVMIRGGNMPTSKSLALIGFGLLFAIGYVLARLCLVLPAAAVDLRLNLPTARRYSQGNGWRLFVVLILLAVLAYFIGAFVVTVAARLLMIVFDAPFSIGPRSVLTLIEEVVGYLLGAPFIAAMALAFRDLTGWRPNGEIRPLPQPQAKPTQPGA